MIALETKTVTKGDNVTFYFLFTVKSTIIRRTKSSGTVTLDCLEPHYQSAASIIGVVTNHTSFDTKGVSVASAPTSYQLTYSLGSDTISAQDCEGFLTGRMGITGYTCYLTIKENIDDADASAIVATSWTSHISAANGHTSTTVDFASKTPGTYFYDVQLKDGSNNVVTCGRGTIIIEEDVTDSEA